MRSPESGVRAMVTEDKKLADDRRREETERVNARAQVAIDQAQKLARQVNDTLDLLVGATTRTTGSKKAEGNPHAK